MSYTCSTQRQLEKDKYELVCLLFDSIDTYEAYNEEFFTDAPVCVLHIGGGRYAILDGHHRLRRFAELAGDDRPTSVVVITTDADELVERFRQEVQEVREHLGTWDIRELPIV